MRAGVSGGENKRMVKQPTIGAYLQAHHPAVWKIVDDLAMQQSLNPRRGGAITFLLPDSKLVAKLQKVLESDKAEEATDILSSLILKDLFKSAADFEKKKDDIPNMLGETLQVEKTAGGKVEVAGKGTLTFDEKFRPFDRQGTAPRGNMAIWKLDGEVKLGTPRATYKYSSTSKPGANPKAAAAASSTPEPEVEGGEEELYQHARKLVTAQLAALEAAAKDGSKIQCEFSRAVACVLADWCEDQADPAKLRALKIARSLMTQNQYINFLVLFTAPNLFPPDLVLKCVDSPHEPKDLQKFIAEFTSCDIKDDGLVLTVDGIADLQGARETIVEHISGAGIVKAPALMAERYRELESENKLGDMTGVYPKELASIFAANHSYKLMLDDAYCWIYHQVQEMHEDDPEACAAHLKAFIDAFAMLYPQGLQPGSRESKVLECGGLDTQSEAYANKIRPFIEGFSLRIPTTPATRNAKYAIVGGDDDEDEAAGPGPVPYDVAGANYEGAYEATNVGAGEFKRKLKKYLKKKGKVPKKMQKYIKK